MFQETIIHVDMLTVV